MTHYQAVLAEARGLAGDEKLDVQERIDLLIDLSDDLRTLIDELRNEHDVD